MQRSDPKSCFGGWSHLIEMDLNPVQADRGEYDYFSPLSILLGHTKSLLNEPLLKKSTQAPRKLIRLIPGRAVRCI